MRALGMLSLTALILTGLPPAPVAPLAAAAQRGERSVRGEDPDARCAPFFAEFGNNDYSGYGRGRVGRPSPVYAPPPPPPPPSPPPPPVTSQEEAVAVTGTRVPQPNLQSNVPVARVPGSQMRFGSSPYAQVE